MNILILNWRDPQNPKAGGAELVTLNHAKAWVKAGYSVFWFSSSFKNAKHKEVQGGITFIRRGSDFTAFLFAPFYYFFSGIQFDIVIDEVHGFPFFTPFFVKKPKLIFIHEVAAEIWNYMYPFPINILGRFLETFYLPLYKHIPLWTDAQSTLNELEKFGFQKENSIAIACPMVNKALYALPKKEKKKTFIFVSRVVRMKGVEEVIKSFGFIFREDPSAQLWIVGKGDREYVERLKAMTRDYRISKNVTFFGEVGESKKLSLMRRAHLLLHASVKEGWGLVVVEAASQGTPSVVYNVSGLRDSVKNGKTGIVLAANSPHEMAQQAYSLLGEKVRYKRLQKGGLQWARSLTWSNATKKSLALLKEVRMGYNGQYE